MRTISENEFEFLVGVESVSGQNLQLLGLSRTSVVEPMADGDMGSIRFASCSNSDEPRSLGRTIVQGEFDDSDDVLVSFTITVDNNKELFELDLWRVDFEPLQSLPAKADQIRFSPVSS